MGCEYRPVVEYLTHVSPRFSFQHRKETGSNNNRKLVHTHTLGSYLSTSSMLALIKEKNKQAFLFLAKKDGI